MSAPGSEMQWLHEMCEGMGLVEGSHIGHVDFRRKGKIVVNIEDDSAITIKLPIDEQQALVHEFGEGVTLPKGWGQHGWTTLKLDHFEHHLIGELIDAAISAMGPRKKRGG
jgi:hypothetical protein